MPVSQSDFLTQVAAHIGNTGAIFRTTQNPDGSSQIWRSAIGTPGVSGGPSSPWTLWYGRVVYDLSADRVLVSDGQDLENVAASTAAQFISGLN